MAVTIKQISEACGVSRGTVDRVLNGRGRVSPETAAKVHRTAKQLGYTPNLAGRALAARKKSYVIGVLLTAEGNPFFTEVLAGIQAAEKELAEYGVRVLLRSIKGYQPQLQLAAMKHMAGQVHAMILNPVDLPEVAEEINCLCKDGIPVVTINTDIEGTSRICYVGVDYEASGRIACGVTGLLLPAGGKIGIFSGSPQVLGHRQRVQGFCNAAARYPALQIQGTAYTQDDDEIGYQQARIWCENNPDAKGVFIAAAGTAGVCRAVAGRGLVVVCVDAVPTTLSMLRSGEIKAAISQQPFVQGYQAVKAAFSYLLTGNAPEPVLVNNEIIIAESLP